MSLDPVEVLKPTFELFKKTTQKMSTAVNGIDTRQLPHTVDTSLVYKLASLLSDTFMTYIRIAAPNVSENVMIRYIMGDNYDEVTNKVGSLRSFTRLTLPSIELGPSNNNPEERGKYILSLSIVSSYVCEHIQRELYSDNTQKDDSH